MNRKWMTVLLTLMLAVLLPLQALAGTQYTLTAIPGEELASMQPVADLFDVTAIKLTTGEKSGALTISLSDKDILTLALGADAKGLYVQSNILSDDVLYVSWDDGFAMLTDLLKESMQQQGALDEATAEMLDASMAEIKTAVLLAMETEMQQQPFTTPEEGIAMAVEMFKDDPAMVEYIQNVYEGMKVESGEFTAEGRDAADGRITLTMDNEDLLAVCDTNYMRSMVEQIVLTEQPELTGEALAQQVDGLLEEVREIYRNTDMGMTMTVYTLSQGQDLVGMDMDMTMTVTEDGTSETVAMTMDYNRLTDEAGVSHKAGAVMQLDGEEMMNMVFDLYCGENGESKGSLAALSAGEQVTFLYRASEADGVRQQRVELYARSGAAAIIEPSAFERPLITFCLESREADPAVLADMENATEQTALNLGTMAEQDMQALGESIEDRAMQVLYTALGSLPTSVLNAVSE